MIEGLKYEKARAFGNTILNPGIVRAMLNYFQMIFAKISI